MLQYLKWKHLIKVLVCEDRDLWSKLYLQLRVKRHELCLWLVVIMQMTARKDCQRPFFRTKQKLFWTQLCNSERSAFKRSTGAVNYEVNQKAPRKHGGHHFLATSTWLFCVLCAWQTVCSLTDSTTHSGSALSTRPWTACWLSQYALFAVILRMTIFNPAHQLESCFRILSRDRCLNTAMTWSVSLLVSSWERRVCVYCIGWHRLRALLV